MAQSKNQAARVGGPSPTAEAASTERLLTTEDVAVVLKVSVRTVERMLHDGEITPVRLRGLVRFRLEDVFHDTTEVSWDRREGETLAGGQQMEHRRPPARPWRSHRSAPTGSVTGTTVCWASGRRGSTWISTIDR